MATETFSVSSGTFGFIMGSITLLGLIINMARFHLPSNKIKVLESLLEETETFFKKAIEDGLLIEPNFVSQTEQQLEILKHRTRSLQSLAYNATTLSRDCAEFFRGTTTSIGRTCQSLKNLRAEVISSSEEGRRRLMEMNSAPQPTPPVVPTGTDTQSENCPTLPSTVEVVRPRSCPLSGSLDDTQSGTAPIDPFNDPTQAGSDVQTTDTQNCVSDEYTSVNLELEA